MQLSAYNFILPGRRSLRALIVIQRNASPYIPRAHSLTRPCSAKTRKVREVAGGGGETVKGSRHGILSSRQVPMAPKRNKLPIADCQEGAVPPQSDLGYLPSWPNDDCSVHFELMPFLLIGIRPSGSETSDQDPSSPFTPSNPAGISARGTPLTRSPSPNQINHRAPRSFSRPGYIAPLSPSFRSRVVLQSGKVGRRLFP